LDFRGAKYYGWQLGKWAPYYLHDSDEWPTRPIENYSTSAWRQKNDPNRDLATEYKFQIH